MAAIFEFWRAFGEAGGGVGVVHGGFDVFLIIPLLYRLHIMFLINQLLLGYMYWRMGSVFEGSRSRIIRHIRKPASCRFFAGVDVVLGVHVRIDIVKRIVNLAFFASEGYVMHSCTTWIRLELNLISRIFRLISFVSIFVYISLTTKWHWAVLAGFVVYLEVDQLLIYHPRQIPLSHLKASNFCSVELLGFHELLEFVAVGFFHIWIFLNLVNDNFWK